MFIDQLTKFGLTKTQSGVLDYLLEHGESKAGDIARASVHPRGVVYKALDELFSLGLAEKFGQEKGIAKWRASHPRNLENILEKQEREISRSKSLYTETLPDLISCYNVSLNKPGVKFYEGQVGMEKILDDILNSKTEILLFINTEAMREEEFFKAINEAHKRKRTAKGIKKRILRAGPKPVSDFGIPGGRYDELTDIRYLENFPAPFKSSVQIYDNKISYQTIEGANIISVLVEDRHIYELNKAWFEALWQTAK